MTSLNDVLGHVTETRADVSSRSHRRLVVSLSSRAGPLFAICVDSTRENNRIDFVLRDSDSARHTRSKIQLIVL